MPAALKRLSPLTVLLAVVLACAMGSLALVDTANAAVVPAKVKCSSATSPAAGKIQVVVQKVKGAKGYQYQVSQKKSFKGKSTLTKKLKKTKAVFSGLAKGKRYYVRVRAYKGSKYGTWSVVKSVVVKKAASKSSTGKSSSNSGSKSSGNPGSKADSNPGGNSGASSGGNGSSSSSGSKTDTSSGSSSSASPSDGNSSTGPDGNSSTGPDGNGSSGTSAGGSGTTRGENELPSIPA